MSKRHRVHPSVPARFRTRGTGQLNGARPKKGVKIKARRAANSKSFWMDGWVYEYEMRRNPETGEQTAPLQLGRRRITFSDRKGRTSSMISGGRPDHAARSMPSSSVSSSADWRRTAVRMRAEAAGDRAKKTAPLSGVERAQRYAKQGSHKLTDRQRRQLWKKRWLEMTDQDHLED